MFLDYSSTPCGVPSALALLNTLTPPRTSIMANHNMEHRKHVSFSQTHHRRTCNHAIIPQGMEANFLKHLMPFTHAILPKRLQLTNSVSKDLVNFPLFRRRSDKRRGCSCTITLSKRSAYQDFQGFAKPSRLLPATEANILIQNVSDEIISSAELDQSSSFYMVELRTSKEFGSCLQDLNAAILLSLISANGNSILQRISAVSWQLPDETVRFQRGSVDWVTFKGPKLENIESLWIGLESGSWRLDGVTLTVVNIPESSSNTSGGTNDKYIDVMQYKFEANNILLGEGGGMSVVELRPALVTESPSKNLSTFLEDTNASASISSVERAELSNEESMREYSDLKFSLLLYDFILFFSGSLILFSSNEGYAFAFLLGGISGLFYLLLLQKSVDGLSTGGELENFVQGIGKFKGPLFVLAFILASSVVAVKYDVGGSSKMLTPAELLIGVGGFLTCKVAVVLAAFKPIKRG